MAMGANAEETCSRPWTTLQPTRPTAGLQPAASAVRGSTVPLVDCMLKCVHDVVVMWDACAVDGLCLKSVAVLLSRII